MKQPQRSKRPTSRRSDSSAVTGTVRANARGFGFVEPTSGPDIFIPAPLMNGLLDGDTVTVDVVDTAARAVRRTGRTRTIIHGRVSQGTFTADPSIGSLTAPLKGSFHPDEIVAVRLQDRRNSSDTPTVTLVERLGTLDNADTLTKVIFARHQLPIEHNDNQISEARRAAQTIGRRRNRNRRDLRDQLVVTVDAPYSQDLDDAVAATVDPDGHIRVWVHIADVSEHVTPGSALDRGAFTTPTSVYFPEFVRPMLPEVLAHDVLSLLPGVDRDTLTVEMRISPSGQITAVDVYESLTRSRTRLSYSTVAQILNGARGKKLQPLDGEDLSVEVVDTIGWLWAAASRLGQSRNARGGVDAFRVDSTPGQERREDNAHLLIERLMVAANESVARWLTERGIPALYRVHDTIDAESAEELEKIADAFGVKAHLGRPVTPQAFAAFAASLDQSRSAGLWDAILGLLGRARYSTDATGHFGLGADQYLHFTSPIRRYADLCVHRLVKNYLNGNRDVVGVRADLDVVASAINPVLRRADLAMRDADRSAALANVKLDKPVVNGVVTSVTARGLSVLTPLASVAVFVPSRAIGKGRRIDQGRRALVNNDGSTVGVGGRLEINVISVDVLAGRIEGSLERSSKSSARGERRPKSERPTSRREATNREVPERRDSRRGERRRDDNDGRRTAERGTRSGERRTRGTEPVGRQSKPETSARDTDLSARRGRRGRARRGTSFPTTGDRGTSARSVTSNNPQPVELLRSAASVSSSDLRERSRRRRRAPRRGR